LAYLIGVFPVIDLLFWPKLNTRNQTLGPEEIIMKSDSTYMTAVTVTGEWMSEWMSE
jgi:hypothetical protein